MCAAYNRLCSGIEHKTFIFYLNVAHPRPYTLHPLNTNIYFALKCVLHIIGYEKYLTTNFRTLIHVVKNVKLINVINGYTNDSLNTELVSRQCYGLVKMKTNGLIYRYRRK